MSDDPRFSGEPHHGTQILWGRVVVLLLALALAFWLGTTFGGDAAAQARLERQRAEIVELESQVASLEAQVAAVDAGGSQEDDASATGTTASNDGGEGQDGGGDGQDGGEGDDTTASADGAGEYVVQSGDSLASIAQEVYGDPTMWGVIARANDLSEPYALTVGDTLVIPEQP